MFQTFSWWARAGKWNTPPKQTHTQAVSQEADKHFAKLHFLLILPADQMVMVKSFALDQLFNQHMTSVVHFDYEKWLMERAHRGVLATLKKGQVRPLLVPHVLIFPYNEIFFKWKGSFKSGPVLRVIFWGFVCYWSTAVSTTARCSSGSCREHWGMCQERAHNIRQDLLFLLCWPHFLYMFSWAILGPKSCVNYFNFISVKILLFFYCHVDP